MNSNFKGKILSLRLVASLIEGFLYKALSTYVSQVVLEYDALSSSAQVGELSIYWLCWMRLRGGKCLFLQFISRYCSLVLNSSDFVQDDCYGHYLCSNQLSCSQYSVQDGFSLETLNTQVHSSCFAI